MEVPLKLRQVLGRPLTAPEMDDNLSALKTGITTLDDSVKLSLNDDGTLKDGAVTTAAKLANRVVTREKLALDALPVYEDTGTSDAYEISPSPAAVAYANRQVFIVRARNSNTGASTLKVNSLAAIPIRKAGSVELGANDIAERSMFAVVYYDNFFHLLSGTGSGGGSVNDLGGVNKYDSEGRTIPAAGGTEETFDHEFGKNPDGVNVSLVCVIAGDGAYQIGDAIPIGDVLDSATTGKQAFHVYSNITSVKVQRLAAATALYDMAGTELTEENWLLQVGAFTAENHGTVMRNSLEFAMRKVLGGVTYGPYLFYLAYGARLSKCHMQRLDMQKNVVRRLDYADDNQHPTGVVNMACFRRADGKDYAVWTSDKGVYTMPLADPSPTTWQPNQKWDNQTCSLFKPVWLVEAAGVISEIYAIASSYTGSTGPEVDSITLKKLSNAANYGTTLSLVHDSVVNNTEFKAWHTGASENSRIVLFQYNPVSKRIYVVTEEMLFMHIFRLTTDTNNFKDWWDLAETTRASKLSYEKTIVIPTGGNGIYAGMHVNFDLTTGVESSVTILGAPAATIGATTQSISSISLAPWQEERA